MVSELASRSDMDTATPEPNPAATLEVRYKSAEEVADKHGYYYSALSDEDKIEYRLAARQEGLTEEIKLLKMTLKNMYRIFPFDYMLFVKLMELIERLQTTHARLFNKERQADSGKKLDKISDRLSSSFGVPMNRAMRRAMAKA